jgi:hypothetical protein
MSWFGRGANSPVNAAKKNAINKIGEFSQANYEAIVAEGLIANNRITKRQVATAKANAAKNAAIKYANALAKEKANIAVRAQTVPAARQNANKAAAAAAAANVISKLKLGGTNQSRNANVRTIASIISKFNSSRFPTFVGTTRISKNIRNALVAERNRLLTGSLQAQGAAAAAARPPIGVVKASNSNAYFVKQNGGSGWIRVNKNKGYQPSNVNTNTYNKNNKNVFTVRTGPTIV